MARKIYTLGETTYDIIFKDDKPVDAKVGGSQLNTSISLGRLGLPVDFVSQLGNDKVGRMSQEFLLANGVITDHITLYNGNSRVALAFLDQANNAEYIFLKPAIKAPVFFPDVQSDDIVLFGSSYAINPDIRTELIAFLKHANQQKAIVIYDPNFRKNPSHNIEKIKAMVEENIQYANIVKGSDEDFSNIYEVADSNCAYQKINQNAQLSLVYTAGKNGVNLHTPSFSMCYPVPAIQPVSTIGAGDNFSAGIIYSLMKLDITYPQLGSLSEPVWKQIIHNATQFAQIVCMSYDNYLPIETASRFRGGNVPYFS